MPDDASEDADSIRESMGGHDNGFEQLWYVLKVVVGMMDEHTVPMTPVYKGNLSRHAGSWDVHQMMMTHRGTRFTQQACTVAFLRSIVCPRFGPAAKVELGILNNAIPTRRRDITNWVMPRKYEVRAVAQRVLQDSPEIAKTEEALGKMGRPTFRRLMYDDVDDRRREEDRPRRGRQQADAWMRADDSGSEDTHETQSHLQGFDPVVKIANMERQRGPGNPPDPRAARERRRRRPPRYKFRCKACGKFGHEEARCEFLAMYIYCKRYMKDRPESEIQSVFDHWMRRNEEDVSYGQMKNKIADREMSVKRMAAEVDWAYFTPLSMDECFELEEPRSESSEDEDDE